MKAKTGAELIPNCIGLTNNQLASVIDSNTALAVKDWQDKYFVACDKITKLESHEEGRTSYYEGKLFECEEHRSVKAEELELCKAHNLMLSDVLRAVVNAHHYESGTPVEALLATKESIEAYRSATGASRLSIKLESELLTGTLRILGGIKATETESENGWWETSTGAEFGSDKLLELIKFMSVTVRSNLENRLI